MTSNPQKTMPLWLIWIIAPIALIALSAIQVALDPESAPTQTPRVERTA
ncbi:hypothetical protein G5S35_08320 [Paraburkholderia tropica]|nr:hypothetical protein [Paraburkholderia tropica]QNB11581.1 hypothetical protein G5S35_08320 [Paraburkholderia tropica]